MDRRELLRCMSSSALANGVGVLSSGGPLSLSWAQDQPQSLRGLPPLKITDIKTILTAPNQIRLVVVKVMTSEPGLYGLGCATFTQRAYAVQTAVEQVVIVRRDDQGPA